MSLAGTAFQRGLSRWNALFLDTASRDDRYCQHREAPRSFEGLPSHGWPTFVDADRIAQWARLSVALRGLVLQIGMSLIPDEASGIAGLFGYQRERASVVARLLGNRERRDAVATRADFLISDAGLKCCEIDFGDVGLWHLESVHSIFRHSPVVKQFELNTRVRVQHRRPLRTMIEELLRRVSRQGSIRVCNFAMLVPDTTPAAVFELGQQLTDEASFSYREVMRQLGVDGEFLLARVGDLNCHGDQASIEGQRVHVVMTQNPSLEAEALTWIESPLLDLVERGHVCAVNGPDCSAMGNKIVLALLSEAADERRLDGEVANLVRSTLPWTRRVRPVRVVHRARESWLPDLLVSRKNEFVLKPGEGFAGDGVKIGKNMSPSDWEHAVAASLAHGNWIAQETVGGVPMWLLGSEGGLKPHAVNIGVVLFGREYTGTFLRLMATASPDEIPIIGYSSGALTGGVVEVAQALSDE